MTIKRRFEIKNRKYWQCWVDGNDFIREWGAIGWRPRRKVMTFASEQEALDKMNEMIWEKYWYKKYEEVDSIELGTRVERLGKAKIIKFLFAWLQKKNWDVVINRTGTCPPDVVATKGKKKWIIAVKGHISVAASRSGNFHSAIGEILQKADNSTTKLSVAFPDLDENQDFWRMFSQISKKRARISSLFIDYQGNVIEKA